MKILVSNDDGVYAPGIQVLAQTLSEIGEVVVVAPDRNRSGASNSLSLTRPLRLKTIENGAISVEGTPTDCVHLALTGLLDFTPDIVVSGINAGANLGDDVLYSGTVAAATEGRFLGFPAIAISLVGTEFKYYQTAAMVARQLVERIALATLPSQTILNVNVPDLPYDKLQGMEVTRLGTRHSAEPTIKQTDPRGNTIYWVGPAGPEQDAGPGSDFHAISHNRVSVSPMKVDLTHHEAITDVDQWLDGLVS
ncbi:MAG: 5'/3'-nucleotidase SurE [Legionellales bacterium]|nr:5'/3'-nucleotidase SurE [Legionellales bacterium]|tara:strand:+ start:18635 stop:19387 length:753 start_codon:yes stop_codon:yes gene_type:complete